MNRSTTNWLIAIVVLIALALWVDLSNAISVPNPFNSSKPLISRDVPIQLGLDLRGGLQTLLEADLPANSTVSSEELGVTRQILESRANALGVSEVVMQTAGERRIVAEFPGAKNPEEVVAALQQTGLLEFVDFGNQPLNAGTVVKTDFGKSNSTEPATTPTPAQPTPTTAPGQPTPTAAPSSSEPV